MEPSQHRRQLGRLAAGLLRQGGQLHAIKSEGTIELDAIGSALRRHLETEQPTLDDDARERMVKTVLDHAAEALAKTEAGVADAQLAPAERTALEAIVHVVGRPAVRFVNGRIGMVPSQLGANDAWIAVVGTGRSSINALSASVGRVVAGQTHLGTAWRVGDDLVVTNWHVARHLVEEPSVGAETWRLDPSRDGACSFDLPGASGAVTFGLKELVYRAPEPEIDLAVLRLAQGSKPWPAPVDIAPSGRTGDDAELRGATIYVIGHPHRLHTSDEIERVFGLVDGSKRWSPGYVTGLRDGQEFEHDCSTLGGSSGSCIAFADTHEVIGLHFGAHTVDELTGMGEGNLALRLSSLEAHPGGKWFKDA